MEVTRKNHRIVTSPLIRFAAGLSSPSPPLLAKSWLTSPANPKNRVDSVPENTSGWIFFREHVPYVCISAVPSFAIGSPPRAISIAISEDAFDEVADSGLKLLQRDLNSLAMAPNVVSDFSRHVLNGIAHWAEKMPDFQRMYNSVPEGSAIEVSRLTLDPRNFKVRFANNQQLALAWKRTQQVEAQWKETVSSHPLPALTTLSQIDLSNLCLQKSIQANAYLVTCKSSSTLYIYKTAIRANDVPGLYSELYHLLTTPPHPYVLPPPPFLVTKRATFGGNQLRGFLLPYISGGSLTASLCAPGLLPLSTRTRWARQIVEALEHVSMAPMGYYPDIKPDNIMIDASQNAVLIDLERKGTWVSWLAPEVVYIRHLKTLAASDSSDVGQDKVKDWPKETATQTREQTRNIGVGHRHLADPISMTDPIVCLSNTPSPAARHHHLSPLSAVAAQARTLLSKLSAPNLASQSRNSDWTLLTSQERESAMVFMAGKLLWCIFESQPCISAATFTGLDIFAERPCRSAEASKMALTSDQSTPPHSLDSSPSVNSVRHIGVPDTLSSPCPCGCPVQFPTFHATPEGIRHLIQRCTLGAPEWTGRRRGIKIVGSCFYPQIASSSTHYINPDVKDTALTPSNQESPQHCPGLSSTSQDQSHQHSHPVDPIELMMEKQPYTGSATTRQELHHLSFSYAPGVITPNLEQLTHPGDFHPCDQVTTETPPHCQVLQETGVTIPEMAWTRGQPRAADVAVTSATPSDEEAVRRYLCDFWKENFEQAVTWVEERGRVLAVGERDGEMRPRLRKVAEALRQFEEGEDLI